MADEVENEHQSHPLGKEVDQMAKKGGRSNPYGKEIPPNWTEQRIASRRVANLQKFSNVLKNIYGEEYLIWVSAGVLF